MNPGPRPVSLVGARGSGKTTVGALLAGALGRDFVDLDDRIVAGRPAGEVLAEVGEPAFRRLELEALGRILEAGGELVLATGGGVVETDAARDLLGRQSVVVWLQAGPRVLRARLAADPTLRPALDGPGGDALAEIETVLARREGLYRSLAHHVVDAEGPEPQAVVARIQRALATPP